MPVIMTKSCPLSRQSEGAYTTVIMLLNSEAIEFLETPRSLSEFALVVLN